MSEPLFNSHELVSAKTSEISLSAGQKYALMKSIWAQMSCKMAFYCSDQARLILLSLLQASVCCGAFNHRDYASLASSLIFSPFYEIISTSGIIWPPRNVCTAPALICIYTDELGVQTETWIPTEREMQSSNQKKSSLQFNKVFQSGRHEDSRGILCNAFTRGNARVLICTF